MDAREFIKAQQRGYTNAALVASLAFVALFVVFGG